MANETTKTIVDKIQQICEDHTSVNFFDFSKDGTFLFQNNAEVDKYPVVFLQLIDEQITGHNATRTFSLYSLQGETPPYDYDKADDFDYNDTLLQTEDSALQIIRDVLGRFTGENAGDFVTTATTATPQNDTTQGVVGWRQDFTVESVFYHDDSNFPERE